MSGPGRRRGVALGVAVVVSLSLALYLAVGQGPPEPGAGSAAPSVTSPGPDDRSAKPPAPSAPPPSRATPPARPPAGSLHVDDVRLAHYRARRVDWSDVISRGRPLPETTSQCKKSWRTAGKDARLDWTSVEYFCLDAIAARGFKPQGIAGSATAVSYSVGSRPAAERNIVLTSWYSRSVVPDLFAPNHTGESVTRLVVLDLDLRRYNVVELVRPDGPDRFRNLNSHGSGLAWAGQYLYSSSHSKLWMYNADDLLDIGGRFVLPAVAKWTAAGTGGLSSISLDRSISPNRLHGINYSRHGEAHLHSFDLAHDGLLKASGGGAAITLTLKNQFGEKGRTVHSARSSTIPGTRFQGVASAGRYTFSNSSGVQKDAGRPGQVDATVVLKDGAVIDSIRMPQGNGESVYIDYRRGTYLSLTEGGAQFFFAIPLKELIRTAGRK